MKTAGEATMPCCIKCVCSRDTKLQKERSFGSSPNMIVPTRRFSYRTSTNSASTHSRRSEELRLSRPTSLRDLFANSFGVSGSAASSHNRFCSLNERDGESPRFCRATTCQTGTGSNCLALTANCQGGTNQLGNSLPLSPAKFRYRRRT